MPYSYSPHACSSHRHDKHTQLFLVWCLFRAIAEFNDEHMFQLPTCVTENLINVRFL